MVTKRSRLFPIIWLGPVAIIVLAGLVLLAITLRNHPLGQHFIEAFPGESEPAPGTPVGFPGWLRWQHFLNSLFILLIIRTGWQMRSGAQPSAFWTRTNRGPFATRNPPSRISLTLWLHMSLDVLWVINGIVFYVLLFASGQWLRIVPTSWDVVPNAISAALQYVSLDWPVENGWTNYNSLQLIAYFVTVFIAAPLAILTGIRMSPLWPRNSSRASRVYPLRWARALHFPVMVYFVLFVLVHVTLVLATGALRNLNHMYAGRDEESWLGFWIFAASVVAMIAAWLVARPLLLRPVASLTGKVGR